MRQVSTNINAVANCCASALSEMGRNPGDPSTASNVRRMREALKEVEHDEIRLSVLHRQARAIIMESTMNTVGWTKGLIDLALSGDRRAGWLLSLVTKLENLLSPASTSTHIEISSADYLPFQPPLIYSSLKPRNRYAMEQRSIIIRDTIAKVMGEWFGVPNDPTVCLSSTLIQILVQRYGKAVLLLEPIWDLFNDPWKTLVYKGRRARRTKKEGEKATEYLQKVLPPVVGGDATFLQDLDSFATGHPSEETQTRSKTIRYRILIKPLLVYLNVMQDLELSQPQSDRRLATVVNEPDLYYPFSHNIPSSQAARRHIFDAGAQLKTQAGLFNVILYRLLYFNSEFASEELRYGTLINILFH